jgi:hypothetical protein
MDWGQQPVNLIHVGGEILTCDSWDAAVMLLEPEESQSTIAYLERHDRLRGEWVRRTLGTCALAPYVVSQRAYPGLIRVVHAGVGGVALDRAAPALRREVLSDLDSADAVGVRDSRTQTLLAGAGIAARLVPDPAVMVATLFGDKIRGRAGHGAVGAMLRAFPNGYLAVQFSADFGDDATLTQIAAQLDAVTAAQPCGVALFRAGAAPWHDDLACLGKAAARMRNGSARVFESVDLWDICALIAHSRGYCGSSLHGRIVAMAFALPRVNLRCPAPAAWPSKQAAFSATWDDVGVPAEVDVSDIATGIQCALQADQRRLRTTAQWLADRYRQDFTAICDVLA